MMIHVWRRTPTLLFALFTLVLIARPAGAEHKNGFQFRAEGAYAEFSAIDPLTGIVTDVSVYAADDEGYRATGDTAPERGSTLIVSITQYDPTCQGGGGKLDVAPEAGGGDPSCFYRELSGMLPTKDGAQVLPQDAFAVSRHRLDGAWLTATLTLVEWGPDGEPKTQEATLSLNWAATGEIRLMNENELYHQPYPDLPIGTQTGHRHAQQRSAAATGTITFDGLTYGLTSSFAVIWDFQEVLT